MNKQQLETYLHEQIPLTRHMQITVKTYTNSCIELAAPLDANSNLHGTAFGGSIGSLAVLCGWTWLNNATAKAGIDCDLVVQKSEMTYESAISENFYARCVGTTEADWQQFLKLLKKRKRSRITIRVDVCKESGVAARLVAVYAAKLR